MNFVATHHPTASADVRTVQILVSIRQTFASKGFDGASMQDLARAAEMSVGNFYRYFPSKAAIVEALVTQDLVEMEQNFSTIINSPHPMQRLRETLEQRIMSDDCAQNGSLWAEITAASLRKPEIGSVTQQMEAEIISYLVAVFARQTGLTPDVARIRFAAHARMIVMMVKACAMQPPMSHQERTDLIGLVIETLNGVLAAVAPTPLQHSV